MLRDENFYNTWTNDPSKGEILFEHQHTLAGATRIDFSGHRGLFTVRTSPLITEPVFRVTARVPRRDAANRDVLAFADHPERIYLPKFENGVASFKAHHIDFDNDDALVIEGGNSVMPNMPNWVFRDYRIFLPERGNTVSLINCTMSAGTISVRDFTKRLNISGESIIADLEHCACILECFAKIGFLTATDQDFVGKVNKIEFNTGAVSLLLGSGQSYEISLRGRIDRIDARLPAYGIVLPELESQLVQRWLLLKSLLQPDLPQLERDDVLNRIRLMSRTSDDLIPQMLRILTGVPKPGSMYYVDAETPVLVTEVNLDDFGFDKNIIPLAMLDVKIRDGGAFALTDPDSNSVQLWSGEEDDDDE